MLSTLDIGKPAIYNWYNQHGNLVFVGKDFEMPATNEQRYRLEVIALSDGYKDYDEVTISYLFTVIEPRRINSTP